MSGTATLDERFQYRDGDLAQSAVTTATLNGDGSVKSTGSYTDTYIYNADGQPLELLRQRGTRTDRYWYVLDGRGNVVALTDSSGAVVDRYAYDPWGEGLPEGTSESVAQPLRYAGYWWDKELGWYWVNVRSYDPEGRWLQPDPSEQDGVRTYTYVDDDPADFDDPSGFGKDVPWCRSGPATVMCPTGTLPGKRGSAAAVQAAYMFLVGEDLSTLGSNAGFIPKALALVDLASNITLIVPVEGEASRIAVKGAALELKHLVARGARDTAYRYSIGRPATAITRTIAHYTNRESYFYDVAKK